MINTYKEIMFIFSTIVLFSIFIFNLSYADTSGIWLRAEDVLGGNETHKATFGSDFEEKHQNFEFYSGTLTIGTENDNNSLLRFEDNWIIGLESDKFVFNKSNYQFINFNSKSGFDDSTNIKIPSYNKSSIKLKNKINNYNWNIKSNSNNNLIVYNNQMNKENLHIKNKSSSKIKIGDEVVIQGNNLSINENITVHNNIDINGGIKFPNGGKIRNLSEPSIDSDIANKEYVNKLKARIIDIEHQINSLQ